MQTKPTANIFFDTRTKLKVSGKHPIKLTVYYLGEKRRYKLPHYFRKNEWEKINGPRLKDNKLKEEKVKLDYYTGEKFEQALRKIDEPFTFQKFKEVYFEKSKSNPVRKDVSDLFERVIKEKEAAGKVGTAGIYRTALNSFLKYRSRLSFKQITPDFLSGYEKYMKARGRKTSYISINLRHLRAIFNVAIHEKIIGEADYPFSRFMGDKKYKIKKGSNRNIALNTEELKQLREYQSETDAQRKAYLLWWFSFYCNGMNIKDICLLQYKHIRGDTIEYLRAKTIDTEVIVKPIKFKISQSISSIITELANDNDNPETYMFDVLRKGDSAHEVRRKVQNLTRVINTHMKKIAEEKLKLSKEITTYTARHSYATYLYRTGFPIEEISEALGHASVETTRRYLASFDDETLQKQSDKLEEI